MSRLSLLAVTAFGLVLAGCDAVAPSDDRITAQTAAPASLVDWELRVDLDNGSDLVYFISESGDQIVCREPSPSADEVWVHFTGSGSETSNCDDDATLDRGVRYLAYVPGQKNAVYITPAPAVGSYNVDGIIRINSNDHWADTSSDFVHTTFELKAGRHITFTIGGVFVESSWVQLWTPNWDDNGALFRLPGELDVFARITYRPTSGGTTTFTSFNGVGSDAQGNWSAQVNTTVTAKVRDELSLDWSQRTFTVQPDQSPPKCLPSDPDCF